MQLQQPMQQQLDNLVKHLDRIFRTFSPLNDFLLKKMDFVMNVMAVEPTESVVEALVDHVDIDYHIDD